MMPRVPDENPGMRGLLLLSFGGYMGLLGPRGGGVVGIFLVAERLSMGVKLIILTMAPC